MDTFTKEEIVQAKENLLSFGFSVLYRNRNGKQYFTVKIPEFSGWASGHWKTVRNLLTKYFPNVHMTSGGSDNRTFRLNPKEGWELGV